MPFRAEQLAKRIQDDLSELIRKRVHDPRVGYVTITRVEVSDDLRVAKVHVSELAAAGQPAGQSIEGLRHAAGFLRTELGRNLGLRFTPELRFEHDRSIEEGIRITTLIDSLGPEPPAETTEGGESDAGKAASNADEEDEGDDT